MNRPPPAPELLPPAQPIECTSGRAAPIVDTLITAFQVVRTGLAIGAKDSAYEGVAISRGADIGIGIALTTLFAVSAGYGFNVAGRCDDAKGRQLERLRALPPPGAYPPGAYPPGAYGAYPPGAYPGPYAPPPPGVQPGPPAYAPAASPPGSPTPPMPPPPMPSGSAQPQKAPASPSAPSSAVPVPAPTR